MIQIAKSLEQLKLDAANGDWGVWCRHWGRNPLDMHPNDERALLDGCRFDLLSANRIHRFYEKYLTVPRGGRLHSFLLYDFWFRDVLGPLFGWKRKDEKRRFDKGFITTAKKSAKSTTLSGLPLYMITCDGELQAEAYSAAVDRDQAAIIYRKCDEMVRHSKLLKSRLDVTRSQKRIYDSRSGSWYEAISSDADSSDGKNFHLLIADELHRWRDREFFNSLMYGGIRREQPLFLMITTAGDELNCVGYEEFEFARDLLDPSSDVYTMSHFAVICQAGMERDESGQIVRDESGAAVPIPWDDQRAWLAANPVMAEGLVDEDESERRLANAQLGQIAADCQEAKTSPHKKREFLRFICNVWISDVAETYIPWHAWEQCGASLPANLSGRVCYGGLDLSSLIDITALCLAFPNELGGFDLKWNFWMPAEDLADKEQRDRVPYRDWIDQGWIESTPGRRVDYRYIRRAISGVTLDEQGAALPTRYVNAAAVRYSLQSVGYDPWNAEKLIAELSDFDGITTFEVRQGFRSMTGPCKRFRELVNDRVIRHGNNPVANWMIRHTIADEDSAGNVKLNRKKSRKRIDGIAAVIDAIAAHDGSGATSQAWSGQSGSGMWG